MGWGIFLLVGFLVLLASGVGWAYLGEKRAWNGGLCPHCLSSWEQRDTDSQGGRMYCCPGCRGAIWVSYPVDRYHENGRGSNPFPL